jgi:hypothetical protein
MKEHEEHSVKWNKSSTGRQMPNNFTYVWNLQNAKFKEVENRMVVETGKGMRVCWSNVKNLQLTGGISPRVLLYYIVNIANNSERLKMNNRLVYKCAHHKKMLTM